MISARLKNKIESLLIHKPEFRFILYSLINDKIGKQINIIDPHTLTEKCLWLKFFYRNPLIPLCSDKLEMRDYILHTIGKEYLEEISGIYNNPADVPFETLPDSFVLEMNRNASQSLLCLHKSPESINKIKKVLTSWMSPESNLYFALTDWWYSEIMPKIMLRQYEEKNKDLEYKIVCYNGRPYFILLLRYHTGTHRIGWMDFYDRDFNWLPINGPYPHSIPRPVKPDNWKLIRDLAESLAAPFPFVSIGFYQSKNQLKVSGFTFCLADHLKGIKPSIWDDILGQRLNLPEANIYEYDQTFLSSHQASPDARLVQALISLENRYGGLVTNVKRNKVSPFDPRTKEQLGRGGMIGGDRMSRHGYGLKYAHYLKKYLHRRDLVLVEVGILRGSGLAIWCDLFKHATIMGLDIDLNHFLNNKEKLISLGAFRKNRPNLYEFDQLGPSIPPNLKSVLENTGIDILIDDGLHMKDAIINTIRLFKPFLKPDWIYIIEDNSNTKKFIPPLFPDCEIVYDGELTIITPRK